jgi:hypothetical protein
METGESVCKQQFCNVKKLLGHEANVNVDVCSSVLNFLWLTISLRKISAGVRVGWGVGKKGYSVQ